jgi:proteasome lid subunit RPN8/RPN11
MQTKHTKLEVTAPDVYIFPSAWIKLFHLLQMGMPNEISGLGKTKMIDGKLVITEIVYVGGDHESAFTRIQQQYQDYMNDMITQERKDELADIHLFWHSHNTMEATWSGYDLEKIHTAFVNASYWVCLVVNAAEDYQCAVFISKPRAVFNSLPLKMYYGEGDTLSADEAIKQADAEHARYHQQFFRPSGPEPAGNLVEKSDGQA